MTASEVCIVGGGPAGLAAALALTKSGREVTVVDCAVPPIDKACGEGLMPESVQTLRELGVTLPPNVGQPLNGIKFVGPAASVAARFPNGEGRGVRRVQLHQLLIDEAARAGVRVLWCLKNVHTTQNQVTFDGGVINTKLIVGADGQQSMVRREAGLNRVLHETRRFAYRRHYQMSPWSSQVEVYWGNGFQLYITPVAADQVCVALISKNPNLRLDSAIARVPVLQQKLRGAEAASNERGSLSRSRRFHRVHHQAVVLLGDAAGSADAITGQGLDLAFKQALALAAALDAGDLRIYAATHRALMKRPLQMARLMLLLDRNQFVQRRALAALSSHPSAFSALLAAHVGEGSLLDLCSWPMLHFGIGFLAA